ncbi:hypothetical protein [Flavobacterium chilense]|uniref:Signal peptide-containing protein n=1 Tax=Flavobacterium chilense TaxID=946677 RepID=A0A1M6Y892_9FLAO|nr:hypothetical protein [Flavobacterium chilense]SHL14209.1 hypothetical protein SAMN05444484_101453 [Flavobacterium chilense]
MKKALLFITSIFLSVIIAVSYGVIHNQFTFTVSDEFFTKLMFERFGFTEYGQDTPRLTASIIGGWSTWWMGLITGTVFSIVSLFHSDIRQMIKSIKGATLITLSTSLIFGFIGLCYGFLGFSRLDSDCCFPLEIHNVKNFIAVSEMHSFSYLGGAVGLLLGIFWQIKGIKKDKRFN